MKLTGREKVSYGLGAVGKDMVYMLSASYILYYYQDILKVSAIAMGIILMAARVFDAFNDPIMGVIVAKTRTKWGRFRPWLLIGTLLNAVILYLMFAAPPALEGSGLVAYAAITYILWGVTYTMMDIPYWSMIPAFTEGGKEREGLSALARTCAGVGSAIVTIITMKCVYVFGQGDERTGFKCFALLIAVLFVVFITITCLNIKEKSTVNVDAPSVGQMFKSLLQNDQAMTVVAAIVLINSSIYITSNLVIYFFKYDPGILCKLCKCHYRICGTAHFNVPEHVKPVSVIYTGIFHFCSKRNVIRINDCFPGKYRRLRRVKEQPER